MSLCWTFKGEAAMASTYSSATLLLSQSLRRAYTTSFQDRNVKPGISSTSDRRRFIVLTSGVAAATFAAGQLTVKAEDIGFFGIRKRVREVEKAEEKVEKGGVEAAETEVEAAERKAETTQEGSKSSDSLGAVLQAGVVAGAEFLGVLIATSFVKGILESEA